MNYRGRAKATALFTSITECRICTGKNLRTVFDLGSLSSCGVFPAVHEPDPPAMPLDLVQCGDCGLIQLRHNFERGDLFRHTYGYRSGINESMKSHLSDLVSGICARVALRVGDVVLDIGSNDGTMLGFYQTPGLIRVGIDPTIAYFKKYYQPGIIAVADFFSAAKFHAVLPGERAKVVTTIAMFYDLPDPNSFVRDIGKVLAQDGLWVLEQSYLPTMVDCLSFDTICHEHLEYYGLAQIIVLMERNGLQVVDAALNDVNGGSFQIYVCHRGAQFARNTEAIAALLNRERNGGYRGPAPIDYLRQHVGEVRQRILEFLHDAKRDGQLVHGYGASTKGNTLLQYFGITGDLLPAIADRNSTKFGCRTPGTGIPIMSEEESRASRPDCYFVLPWHFRDNFIAREQAFLAAGGALVFPLPRFEIVTAQRLPQ